MSVAVAPGEIRIFPPVFSGTNIGPRISCLPEVMKNKLSIASGGDTQFFEEIAHADAEVFIVMISRQGIGGSCL